MGMIYLFSHTSHKGVKSVKSIEINFLRPKLMDENFNALIFTSKNSVIALDKLDINWKKIPSFVIGKATANEVLKLGGEVEFISQKSYGDEFANEIKDLLKDRKILFPRAKNVVSDIKNILTPLKIKELIVYETKCIVCKNLEKPPISSTLIFASPSSVKCFLKCFKLSTNYKIICIGKKTALALPEGLEYKIPKTQSIDECVKLALFIS